MGGGGYFGPYYPIKAAFYADTKTYFEYISRRESNSFEHYWFVYLRIYTFEGSN